MTNPVQRFEDRVSSYARRTNRKTAIRHPVGCGRGYNLLALKLLGQRHKALFIGQWVPTLFILGLYNKLVKQLGSDRTSGFGRSLQKTLFSDPNLGTWERSGVSNLRSSYLGLLAEELYLECFSVWRGSA
jgi:hypothetical protein